MQDQKPLIEKYVHEPVWAVVGASNNRAKYGNRIYLKLRESGYRVFPVNNREQLIEGDRAYSSLLDLPETPAVVNMVVPPQAASVVVEQAKAAGAQAIWFPAGCRETSTAGRWAQEHGLDVIEACILVQLALMPRPEGTESNPPHHSRTPRFLPRPYYLHSLSASRADAGGGIAVDLSRCHWISAYVSWQARRNDITWQEATNKKPNKDELICGCRNFSSRHCGRPPRTRMSAATN